MHRPDLKTTEAEEMYLITVARAVEDGKGPLVPVSMVARALDVSSVSANQMINKLASAGLVDYVPYKGVQLTSDGEQLANVVLRSRRLWGVFFVDHLGLTPKEADEVACELEHVTPDGVADRLSSFLGDPSLGPQGKVIPLAGSEVVAATRFLDSVVAGEAVRFGTAPAGIDALLESQGVVAGTAIEVVAVAPDGSIAIEGPTGIVHLTAAVAARITVTA